MKKFLAFALVLGPVMAGATDIFTLNGSQWWQTPEVSGGGSALISPLVPSTGPGDTGSLQIKTNSSSAKAYATFGNGSPLGTLSQLAAGSISVDLYKSSASRSSVDGDLKRHLAIQFHWVDATGQWGNLTWENAYNDNLDVTTDQWATFDLSNGNFWLRSTDSTGVSATRQNWDGFGQAKTLDTWAAGSFADFPSSDSWAINGNIAIMGWSIGFGSGLGGDFEAYADNMVVNFGNNGASYASNFEFNPVPEPFTMTLGLAGATLAIRRKLKK